MYLIKKIAAVLSVGFLTILNANSVENTDLIKKGEVIYKDKYKR